MAKLDTQDDRQYLLFPHDVKTPRASVCDARSTRSAVTKRTLYRTPFHFKPAPKNKASAASLVLEAMTEFQHKRREWMPNLAHFDEPFCFDLPRGTHCVFRLWTSEEEANFVGARYNKATDDLAIYLPKPRHWKKLSLDWLAAPRCLCGLYDCNPEPFRRLLCPNMARNEAESKTGNLFQG